jgi:hypothetical protein
MSISSAGIRHHFPWSNSLPAPDRPVEGFGGFDRAERFIELGVAKLQECVQERRGRLSEVSSSLPGQIIPA